MTVNSFLLAVDLQRVFWRRSLLEASKKSQKSPYLSKTKNQISGFMTKLQVRSKTIEKIGLSKQMVLIFSMFYR